MTQAVVVLGMHRSGTSSVAGCFAHLGAAPPNTLLAPDWDNPRGFWESRPIIDLDDRILRAAGSYWNDWSRFHPSRIAPDLLAELQSEMREVLAAEFGRAPLIVMKEPRLCRVWSLWEPVMAETGFEVGFVLPIRSPLEVAGSLMKRNGLSMVDGLLLWLRHVLDAEYATRGRPRRILRWDRFLGDWRAEVDRVEAALGWRFPNRGSEASQRVDDFLSGALRTVNTREDALASGPDAHAWVSSVYAALTTLSEADEDPAALAELDRIRAQFELASELFWRSVGALLAQVEALQFQSDDNARAAESAHKVADQLGRDLLLTEARTAELEAAQADMQVAYVEGPERIAAAMGEAKFAKAAAAQVRLARDRLADRLSRQAAEASRSAVVHTEVVAGLEARNAELQTALAGAVAARQTLEWQTARHAEAHAALIARQEAAPIGAAWSFWRARLLRSLTRRRRRMTER